MCSSIRAQAVFSAAGLPVCMLHNSPLSHLSASVGGEIQSLAWDSTGERLAVLLKGLSHCFFCSPR